MQSSQNLNLNCHFIFFTTTLTSHHPSSSDSLSQVTITSSSSNSSSPNKYTMHTGKWSPYENKRFLEGVAKYGGNWKKIQANIRTRTTTQARSHAQKIILKIKHKQILHIPSWVNTIQELFSFMKQFPRKEYTQLYNAVLSIANEDLKKVNKKQKMKKCKKREMMVSEESNDVQIDECEESEYANSNASCGGEGEGANNKKGKEMFCVMKNNSSEDVTELSQDTENESKSNLNGNGMNCECDNNRYINDSFNYEGNIDNNNEFGNNNQIIVRF